VRWYLRALGNYFGFSGRSQRSEYWYFVLFNTLIELTIALAVGFIAAINGVSKSEDIEGWANGGYLIWSVLTFIPLLAVSVRRLHDIGNSGWWIVLCLVPLAGPLILLIWDCTDSQIGTNKYGPNPKGVQGPLPATAQKVIP